MYDRFNYSSSKKNRENEARSQRENDKQNEQQENKEEQPQSNEENKEKELVKLLYETSSYIGELGNCVIQFTVQTQK